MYRNLIKYIFYFLWIFFNLLGHVSAQEWFENNFDELARLRDQIFAACPPRECVYVGVGRSPTAVTAFLSASLDPSIAKNIVIDIPLSGLQGYGGIKDQARLDTISSRFAQVFDTYLPPEKINGKRVVLIDTADSGNTLAAVHDNLSRYTRKKGLQVIVEGHGLGYDNKIPRLLKARKMRVTGTSLNSDLLFTKIRTQYGKFQKILITTEDSFHVVEPNPEVTQRYDQTVIALRDRIQNQVSLVPEPRAQIDRKVNPVGNNISNQPTNNCHSLKQKLALLFIRYKKKFGN
jgi:hypothetical protein